MNFTTIDFETANDSSDSVCAIGLAKYKNGILVETMETLIDPEDYFDAYNIDIHGITEKMVEGAPTFLTFYPTLKKFIENELLIAHYASFDMSVLRFVCEKYDIEFDHHNALEDAKACGNLLVNLFKEAKTSDFSTLLEKANLQLGKIFPGGYRESPTQKSYRSSSLSEISTIKTVFDEDHPFYSQTLVFTGALKSMVRKEAAQKVGDLGAKCGNNITKTTIFLIVGDYDLRRFGEGFKSSKIKKAEQLLAVGQAIEIVGESEFLKML